MQFLIFISFTMYGCELYALWAGEVGKARDELRHPSQMVQMIEFGKTEDRRVIEIADFLIQDVNRIYGHIHGTNEVHSARSECQTKDGELGLMWNGN